ncbi:unnamed protein product [Durusdinium trenchii]
MASYLIFLIGEVGDLMWAPIAGFLLQPGGLGPPGGTGIEGLGPMANQQRWASTRTFDYPSRVPQVVPGPSSGHWLPLLEGGFFEEMEGQIAPKRTAFDVDEDRGFQAFYFMGSRSEGCDSSLCGSRVSALLRPLCASSASLCSGLYGVVKNTAHSVWLLILYSSLMSGSTQTRPVWVCQSVLPPQSLTCLAPPHRP